MKHKSTLQRFGLWLAGIEVAGVAGVREAVSGQGGGAEDEAGWRALTGNGDDTRRSLSALEQGQMQRLADYVWGRNLVANRLVELPLAYLLAEGVRLEVADEAHQAVLDAHWNDAINNWPLKLKSRARDLSLYGELCFVCNVNGGSGAVRLGYLPPTQIERVVVDADNPEQAIGVVTKRDAEGKIHSYKVVVVGVGGGEDAELFSERTARLRETFADGEVLLWQVNKLASASRGRSDLLAQFDWVDAYEEFLFKVLDRADAAGAVLWDVEVMGGDQAAVDAQQKAFKPPTRGPGVWVHNDSVKVQQIKPEMAANDSAEIARLLRNHSLGGATMPEHWFGGGGDVNRAASTDMGEPTFKLYTARQSELKLMLEQLGRYVLWRNKGTGQADWGDACWQVRAVFPELANKDVGKFAAALREVVVAACLGVDKGLLTQETALRLVADVAGRFGQQIDAPKEIEAVRAEMKLRAEAAAAEDEMPAGMKAAMAAMAGGASQAAGGASQAAGAA